MKFISILALVVSLFTSSAFAGGGGFGGEPFMVEKCYEAAKTGSGEFNDPANGIDGDIVKIPARSVIEGVSVVVIDALTGTTVVTVGDDDDADGWVDSGDVTEGTPGAYIGATSSGYADTFMKGKYYGSAGKELKLDITGTLTAGKYCVIAKGYRL